MQIIKSQVPNSKFQEGLTTGIGISFLGAWFLGFGTLKEKPEPAPF
jgi:hypothetical protein